MGHLPRQDRLRKRRDFLRVQRSGFRSKSACVVLVAKRTYAQNTGRVGLTVSKAVGKAHVRNLVKRRLRHLLRQNRWAFAKCDLVVTAQAVCATADYFTLQTDFIQAAMRLTKMIEPNKGAPR